MDSSFVLFYGKKLLKFLETSKMCSVKVIYGIPLVDTDIIDFRFEMTIPHQVVQFQSYV